MATDVESGYLGAATHAALAVVAVFEGMAFKSRTAKLLAGCVFGWHAFAAFWHIQERQRSKTGADESLSKM